MFFLYKYFLEREEIWTLGFIEKKEKQIDKTEFDRKTTVEVVQD
jgi:hypothetical protein